MLYEGCLKVPSHDLSNEGAGQRIHTDIGLRFKLPDQGTSQPCWEQEDGSRSHRLHSNELGIMLPASLQGTVRHHWRLLLFPGSLPGSMRYAAAGWRNGAVPSRVLEWVVIIARGRERLTWTQSCPGWKEVKNGRNKSKRGKAAGRSGQAEREGRAQGWLLPLPQQNPCNAQRAAERCTYLL